MPDRQRIAVLLSFPFHPGVELKVTMHAYTGPTGSGTSPGIGFDINTTTPLVPIDYREAPQENAGDLAGKLRYDLGVLDRHQARVLHTELHRFLLDFPEEA